MHEVWDFGDDVITDDIKRKAHPTALVDVRSGVVGQFSSEYFTENGRRIPMNFMG